MFSEASNTEIKILFFNLRQKIWIQKCRNGINEQWQTFYLGIDIQVSLLVVFLTPAIHSDDEAHFQKHRNIYSVISRGLI